MNVIDRKDEMPSTKTPLRYPGGKSQLTNFIYNTMKINDMEDTVFCEPFAGGAGVAMSLLLSLVFFSS